ncbi:MAG TPA: helix-turn-helix domain-containing protein [Solirubrobacterales bacterium]|nr:helix-turn-helix domain-containing protein [Solirubrobacterales bacterium]
MAATPDTTTPDVTALAARPKRADARRNYDKLVTAARDAFAAEGSDATLEEISRRAGVGIGTLYRHFPARENLVEAAYLDGVEAICCAAVARHQDEEPWEALTGWLLELVGFAATKRVLADEMFAYLDRDAPVFRSCSGAIYDAAEPLLKRAQAAGEVRADVDISDVTKMVSGIAGIRTAEPEQIERLVAIALDGLRPAA